MDLAVLLVYPFLAAMMLSLEYAITKGNYNVPQNGFGSMTK